MLSFSWMSLLESLFFCLWGILLVKFTLFAIKQTLTEDFGNRPKNKIINNLLLYFIMIIGTVGYSALLSGFTFSLFQINFLEMLILNSTLALPIVIWKTAVFLKKEN